MPKSSTSWTKGHTGNRGGRPRGLERMTRDEIEEFTHDDRELGKLTGWKALRRRLWLIGMNGEDRDSIAAIKLLHERAFGMPKQNVKIEDVSPIDAARVMTLSNEQLELLAMIGDDDGGSPDGVH